MATQTKPSDGKVAGDDIESGVVAGEKTPLISDGSQGEDNEPPPLKPMREETMKEKAVAGAAVVSVGTQVAAMIVEKNPSMTVSGVIGAGVAPYAVIQQKKMTQIEALKEVNERMELEVGNLRHENDRLQKHVSDLENSVTHLQEMEQTLKTIRQMEGQSLDELESQLKESQEILNKMEGNLRATVLQNLISVVLCCDKDGDMTIDDDELEQLMLKIERINGVELKEDKFKEKITAGGRSLNAIMDVVRNLLSEDVPEAERIFNLKGVEGM